VKLNKQHPLARGLVRAFLFNEGQGNIVVDYARGKNATLTGGTAAWVTSERGQTFFFDQGLDRVFAFEEVAFTDDEAWTVAVGMDRIDDGNVYHGMFIGVPGAADGGIQIGEQPAAEVNIFPSSAGGSVNFNISEVIYGYHD